MLMTKGRAGRIVWVLSAIAVSASIGMFVDWRAPGVGRYTQDWLMRARGTLPVPEDIAIVAIDEASIARFGRFPWSRQVLARAIDAIAAAQPKAIALDVLVVDPTSQEDDDALARSVGRAGNVVVAAQLSESPVHGGPARWLLPLPTIEHAAAGVGHVNVQTELEGVAREVEVRAADDTGHTLCAMAVETVRVGDGTPEAGLMNARQALIMGRRTIPLDSSPSTVVIAQQPGGRSTEILRGGRMAIDFIGPAGSFEPSTYSLAEVVGGGAPRARLRDKYVLIGATAASLGDRIASPFTHETDAHADQHGALMPGVEVLANEINTILRSRFYSSLSDAATFLWVAAIAALTLALLEGAQGGRELIKQLAVLTGVAAVVVLTGYIAFTRFLVAPPLLAGMVSFASAGILGLLGRSLDASARLDANIAQLAYSGDLLAPAGPGLPGPYHWSQEGGPVTLARGWLPRGLEWKARTLSELNARLLERAKFVDLALRSVDDGLIIAAPDGVITFANRSAADILGPTARGLVGQNLLDRLSDLLDGDTHRRLVLDRERIEREITIRGARPRQYILRMTAVSAGDRGEGPVLGIVAALSDITRQHALQQTKNDVISLVSHEMRTPLTAIQGMTELLAEYDLPADRRREMHLAINDEVKRLTRMISVYLDITWLESGATAVRLAPVRVETVLERLMLLLAPVAAKRGIRLERNFGPDLPAIVADPDLLSQAVENLISNAIKYSAADTEVTVSAFADETAVSIAVADRGYGIPAADLPRIFDKFYRVPRVQDAGVPGTGLGLSLVREIAELHGGSVTVRSEVNAGSTFTLRIPRGEVASQ